MKYKAICENHLYGKAYAKGRKFVGKNVVVYVLPDRKAAVLRRADPLRRTVNRVGLTVTKKIGGAVVRNRVKRILREGFRLCDKENRLKGGNLIVLVARDSAVTAKSGDIKSELERGFTRLGLIGSTGVKDATRAPDAEKR